MLGAEQLLRPIDRELLDLIDHLAAAVIPLPRQPLGVLVGERRPHRFEHRDRDEILARDQLEPMLLPRDLATDEVGDLGIDFREGRLTIGHLSIFSTRRSWRPPSNPVSSHLCRILTPCSSLTNCAGSTRTFEFPCDRDSSATCSFHASAARTRGKRLAAYDMPNPVPQVSTPRCTSPLLTAFATGLA